MSASGMKSALYVGTISHARRQPVAHTFVYPTFMLYLDLAELPTLGLGPLFGVERARPLSFRRADYLGPASQPLAHAVADEVERQLGVRPDGPIRLLTHVRMLGRVFNPVSFYYCFDREDSQVVAVAAEITNTPWKERHTYVVPGPGASFAKTFHVSPFFAMQQRYRWSFSPPGEGLTVAMDNHDDDAAARVFSARLRLQRQPLERDGLLRAAVSQPLVAWRQHAAIYWQALRLYVKGTPFYPHPPSAPSPVTDSKPGANA